MIHAFETNIAEYLNLPAAIIHQEILRWCKYNEKEETSEVFVEGQYWMFTSHARLHKHMNYISIATIRRALMALHNSGLIEKRSRGSEYPNSLLYRANEFRDINSEATDENGIPQSKSNATESTASAGEDPFEHRYDQNDHREGDQNGHRGGDQNDHSEHKKVEHRNLNKEKAKLLEGEKLKKSKTVSDIVSAFYDKLSSDGPETNTAPYEKDLNRCEELITDGFTAEQILSVPDHRPNTSIESFRYVSSVILRSIYPKDKPSKINKKGYSQLDVTNERIDEWNRVKPATEEEKNKAIQACKSAISSATELGVDDDLPF